MNLDEGLNGNYVPFILYEGIGKSIPFSSVLDFAILPDLKMRNVITRHRFILP